MKPYWGDNENDLAVDEATPLLIRMLSLCQDVLDACGRTRDEELTDALNLIDVEERLIDALSTTRTYQKYRVKEMKEGAAE